VEEVDLGFLLSRDVVVDDGGERNEVEEVEEDDCIARWRYSIFYVKTILMVVPVCTHTPDRIIL